MDNYSDNIKTLQLANSCDTNNIITVRNVNCNSQ